MYRHPFSRLAWRRARKGATLFCTGVDYTLPVADARWLAAAETIDGTGYAGLSGEGRDTMMALVAQGHYQLGMAEDED